MTIAWFIAAMATYMALVGWVIAVISMKKREELERQNEELRAKLGNEILKAGLVGAG